ATAARVVALGRLDASVSKAFSFGRRMGHWRSRSERICLRAGVFGAGSDSAGSMGQSADLKWRGRGVSCPGWRLDGCCDRLGVAIQRSRATAAEVDCASGGYRISVIVAWLIARFNAQCGNAEGCDERGGPDLCLRTAVASLNLF